MSLSRLLTALVGIPAVALVLILGNDILISVLLGIATIRCIYEYKNCAKEKYNVIAWIGYIMTIYIFIMPYLPTNVLETINIIGLPLVMIILFLHSVLTNMKITFEDLSITIFGICYFSIFTSFVPRIYSLENGKIFIWYVLIISWGSDIFAYLIGRNFGKHKFSKVSPNKTIEGCTAGILGAIIISVIYTFFINKYANLEINYIIIAWVSALLCIVGQIGDFAASVIKRHFEVKDFSNLFPGHGGMIDRLDSVIAIAPFAYILFMLLV